LAVRLKPVIVDGVHNLLWGALTGLTRVKQISYVTSLEAHGCCDTSAGFPVPSVAGKAAVIVDDVTRLRSVGTASLRREHILKGLLESRIGHVSTVVHVVEHLLCKGRVVGERAAIV
jgi:hypothetical protein